MASRLDRFFTQLFDQLNQQGLSYRTVCGYLKTVDVVISPQALRSWHIRRSQKLMERAARVPVTHVYGPPSNQSARSDRKGLPSTQTRTEPAAQVQGALTLADAAKPRTLQAQIEEEERRLALNNPHFSAAYMVRRRAPMSDAKGLPSVSDRPNQKAGT